MRGRPPLGREPPVWEGDPVWEGAPRLRGSPPLGRESPAWEGAPRLGLNRVQRVRLPFPTRPMFQSEGSFGGRSDQVRSGPSIRISTGLVQDLIREIASNTNCPHAELFILFGVAKRRPQAALALQIAEGATFNYRDAQLLSTAACAVE